MCASPARSPPIAPEQWFDFPPDTVPAATRIGAAALRPDATAKNVANANDGQGISGGAVDGGGNTARANASLVQ